MNENLSRLSIEELAAAAYVPVRTVRYYIAEGLLPGPGARGKGATYSAEHLDRLRLIRRLAARRVPLGEIRDLLARLPADEARAVLRQEARQAEALEAHAAAPSPKDYIAALLERTGHGEGSGTTPASGQPARKVSPAPPLAARPLRFGVSPQMGAANEAGEEVAWRRWTLAPGIELHVRGDIASTQSEVIARLLKAARDVLNPQVQEETSNRHE